MRNQDLAAAFEKLADLLEIQGENPFKLRAYRRAAEVLRGLDEDVADVARQGRLRELPGVGVAIAKKIEQLLTTGKMEKLEQVRSEIPQSLLALLRIPGVGPRTVALAHKRLGVQSIEGLGRAARSGRLARLPGIGRRRAEEILQNIEAMQGGDA